MYFNLPIIRISYVLSIIILCHTNKIVNTSSIYILYFQFIFLYRHTSHTYTHNTHSHYFICLLSLTSFQLSITKLKIIDLYEFITSSFVFRIDYKIITNQHNAYDNSNWILISINYKLWYVSLLHSNVSHLPPPFNLTTTINNVIIILLQQISHCNFYTFLYIYI